MKKIFKSSRKSFTVVELLISMAVTAAVLTMLGSIFTTILSVQTESEIASYMDQDSRFIINRFNYDIPRASLVLQPSSFGTTASTLQLLINGINYSYSLSNGDLILTNNQGTNKLNGFGTHISGLTFRNLGRINGRNTVQIDFTLSTRFAGIGRVAPKTIHTTVGVR